MHFLLVNAPPYKIQESYYDTPPYPRTALACLAGSLRHNNFEVSVLDCKYERLDFIAAMDRIRRINPEVVGFTAFSNEIIQAAALAGKVKEYSALICTVIGGVHASILPEQTLREFPQFDYAILGEGERTIVEFASALVGNRNVLDIPGVAGINVQNEYETGGKREAVISLDDLPLPAWDMFQSADEYIVHTQRGCPFSCPFCVNPNGRRVRTESISRSSAILEGLVANKAKVSVLFGDEVFTIDRARTIDFCREIISRGLHRKIKWWCMTHINCIDYDLALLMREAGCRRVGLGIESGDEAQLKFINKGTSVAKILSTVASLKRAKLPFESYFILGQPNETEHSARQTIEFAVKVNANYPVFGIMVPYPGTRISKMAQAGEGGYKLIATDWNDYNKQLGGALEFSGVERKTLERLQLIGYISVFLRNFRFVDFFVMAWRYRTLAFTLFVRILKNVTYQNRSV